jgi:hypothetical protein
MRCPVCKADNTQGPACRRCKADLSLLWQLESRREGLLLSARCHLARGRRREAERDAMAALRLRDGADARRLQALCRLVARDFAGAWRIYVALGEEEPIKENSCQLMANS